MKNNDGVVEDSNGYGVRFCSALLQFGIFLSIQPLIKIYYPQSRRKFQILFNFI